MHHRALLWVLLAAKLSIGTAQDQTWPPSCGQFTLAQKQRVVLDSTFLLGLHSASPCFTIGDALVGRSGLRYLIAYDRDWVPVDTILSGADSARRLFIALDERRVLLLEPDITFGYINYTVCDFESFTSEASRVAKPSVSLRR